MKHSVSYIQQGKTPDRGYYFTFVKICFLYLLFTITVVNDCFHVLGFLNQYKLINLHELKDNFCLCHNKV